MKLKLTLSILLAILLPLTINVLAAHSTGLTLPGAVVPGVIVPFDTGTPPPSTGTPPPATGTPPPATATPTPVFYGTSIQLDCPTSKKYTGNPITPCTATVTASGDSGWSASAAITYSANIDVGSVSATASYAGDGASHLAATDVTGGFNIDPASSSVNVTCSDVMYNGFAQTPCTASYSTSDGQSGPLDVGYSNNTDVGTGTGSASYGGDSNHDSSNNSANFKITEATSVVAIQCPGNVPYNSSAQTPCSATYSTSDGLSGQLNVSYSNNTNAGTAGAKATYNGDSNHGSDTKSTSFTIDPVNASCSVAGGTYVYDGNSHGLIGSCSGVGSDGTLTINLGTTYKDVPGGTATWSLSNPNYNPQGDTLNIVITIATATCTISPDYSVTYDASAHGATGSCSGIPSEPTLSGLDLGSKFTDVPGGTANWSFSNINYGPLSGSVVITINPANASCNISGDYSITYDGLTHGASGTCSTSGGLVASGLDLGTPGGPDVGSYHIIWSITNPDFNFSNPGGFLNVTINAKAASVSAVATGKTYGALDPALALSKNGFVAGDLSSITFPVARDPGEPVGIYTIRPAAPTGAPVGNYTITLNNANFTITKATPTCNITPYNVSWDGNNHTAGGSCTGALGEDLTSELNLNNTTHNLIGIYNSDTWNFTDLTGNYNNIGNQTITDRINYLVAACTVTPYNVPWDNTFHNATFSCDQPGTLTGTQHLNSASYNDNWTFTSTDGHYRTTGTANDIITQIASFVSVICPVGSGPGGAYYYKGSAIVPPCTDKVTDALNNTLVAPAVVYTNNTNVGTATATANYNGDVNHTKNTGTGSFQITQAVTITTITCNTPPPPYYFTGNPITPCSARVTDPTSGLNLVVPVIYGTNTAVGTATADASYPGDANHTASVATQATFQILLPTVTCTVHGYTVVYDENPHILSTATSAPPNPKNNCVTSDARTLTSYLNYSGASNTNAGSYPDTVTFHDPTGEFPDASYPVTNTINKFTPVCDNNRLASLAYNGPYTATYHGGPVNPQFCAGARGEDLSNGVTYNPAQGYINVPGGNITWTLPASANYNQVTGTVRINIHAIAATCTATGAYNGPYTGTAHAASVTCTSPLGENLAPSITLSSPSSFINPPGGTVHWALSNVNYTAQSGNIVITITALQTITTVTCPASVIYTGIVQTPCTAKVTASDGLNQTLTVTYTPASPTNVGSYTASATYVANGVYQGSSNSAKFSITQATPICTVSGYNVTYDGKPHNTITGTCHGPNGESVSGTLQLVSPAQTNVGTYQDSWSFTSSNPNYFSTGGSVTDAITPADANCSFPNYTVPYDGHPHGILGNGACTGVLGEDLSSSVNPGLSFTDVPGGSASWSFSNANYNPLTGSTTITITQIASIVTVTCPAGPQTYTGSALTPCKVTVTDALTSVLTPAALVYTNNTDVGTATATETYPGDVNHTGSTGSDTFTISGITSYVTVTCPSTPQPYTAQPQTPCSAKYTTGDNLTGSLPVTYTNNINMGTANASAHYAGDANHNPSDGQATFEISKAIATCTVTGYAATYDGNPHTATGTCTGIAGVSLTGLDVSTTAHIDAGNYPNDPWSFTNPDYASLNSTVNDSIARAAPTCTVTPYAVPYDSDSHTVTGSCIGAKGESLSGLNVGGTAHINPGDYPADPWSFTDLITGNYTSANGTVHDSITKADPLCTVTPYTVPFDNNPHSATGSCTGAHGVPLTGLDLSGTTHINAGDYPNDTWTFNNTSGNYNTLSGTVHDIIGKPAVTCTVTPYSIAYDGSAHTAAGYCTGVGGVTVAGIDLSGTTHTDAGDYPGDTWTFTDATGNYANATGTVHDSLTKIKASCSVNPYSLTYDGSAHTATGSCSGLGGVSLSGLDLSGTTHTDAADYAADPWTLKNPNYFASDTVHDVINKTTATCTIVGYTGVYDGLSHAASGDCISAAGAKLPGLNVGQVYKDVPGGSAGWNFINPNVSNAPITGTVNITLTQAGSTVTVTCPDSLAYAGSPLTPCTATATGPGGLNQTLTVSYTNNNDIGTATASANFAGDIDHTGSTASATFNITLGTLAGAPLTGGEGTTVAKNLKGESGTGFDEKSIVAAVITTATPVTTSLATSTKAVVNSGLGADGKDVSTNKNTGKSKTSNFWSTYSGLFGCIGSVFLAMLIFFMFKRRRDDEAEETVTEEAGTDGNGPESS